MNGKKKKGKKNRITLLILEVSNSKRRLPVYHGSRLLASPGEPVLVAPLPHTLGKGKAQVWWMVLGPHARIKENKLNTSIWKRSESQMQIAKEPLLYHLGAAAGETERA